MLHRAATWDHLISSGFEAMNFRHHLPDALDLGPRTGPASESVQLLSRTAVEHTSPAPGLRSRTQIKVVLSFNFHGERK